MFIHGAEFFLFKPGIALLALGLLMTLPLTFGPITVGKVTFSLYTMFIGVTLSVLGLQCIYFGCLAHVFLDYSGRRRARWQRLFNYTKSVITSGIVFAVGFVLDLVLVVHYFTNSLKLPATTSVINHTAITGLLLMIAGFSTFCFTLLLHATQVRYGNAEGDSHLRTGSR